MLEAFVAGHRGDRIKEDLAGAPRPGQLFEEG
jgi:hypothetical protein